MAADSKTEKATPKKRKDERKEGNVFFSTDVAAAAGILASFLVLKAVLPSAYQKTAEFMKKYLERAGSARTGVSDLGMDMAKEFALTAAGILLPILLVCAGTAVLAIGAQTRFLFTAKKFMPKLKNISPLQGIKKLFSLKNAVELLKNIVKVIVLASILYVTVKADFVNAVRTMDMSVGASAAYMLGLAFDMGIKIVLVFAVIAAADYFFQWWQYERQIRMSKQELKEEFKQTEGNPQIKGRIREIQRQRARSRMMQAVPNADVVIRNPTHFAVALQYDAKKHKAPAVVAKGQDELALRIVGKAEEHHVPVIENKPLARGIFAQTEVGKEISPEFYGAVAEILVYVYKLKKNDGA